MKNQEKAKISIGMFVFNAEDRIESAILSILSQTYSNLELIISDNASEDKTEAICKKYANKDKRIKYLRQAKNIGICQNLIFVLKQANSEYFMWAADDDLRSRDFIEVNLNFLKNNKDFVASTSPTSFINASYKSNLMGDIAIADESNQDRFLRCLKSFPQNGRFNSIFRRDQILSTSVMKNYHIKNYMCEDFAFILEMMILGKFYNSQKGSIYVGNRGYSTSGRIYKLYRKHWLDWIFPLRDFTLVVLKLSDNFTAFKKIKILSHLIKYNFLHSAHQIKTELMFSMNSFKINEK